MADKRAVADAYDRLSRSSLARRLGVARLELYALVESTMDVAHELGEAGAPAGSLVLADAQRTGRGRHGSRWRSDPGAGIWMTLLERPVSADALDVLSLRVGLAVAAVLDRFADATVRVKWPNDLFVRDGKLAGVLVEARWRGGHLDWVAIGVGVNAIAPIGMPAAAGLRPGTDRVAVLASLVPAVRTAAATTGALRPGELAEFAKRDVARGRRCVRPSAGVVGGITAEGELAIETEAGTVHHRGGSLVLEEGA